MQGLVGGIGVALHQNLGVIPEHLAEGINSLGRGGDEGLDSSCSSAPCTPTPTPFSPSPAQHSSVLAEQLAAGIHKLKVEEGMSSGGSTGLPATPAPTPFSHGPGGIKPEDLAASISRLSVIQEADTGPSINVLDATEGTSSNITNNLSNYFGTPQSSGESIFDHLHPSSPLEKSVSRSRTGSDSGASPSGFQDISISTPARNVSTVAPSPPPLAEGGRNSMRETATPAREGTKDQVVTSTPVSHIPTPAVGSATTSTTTTEAMVPLNDPAKDADHNVDANTGASKPVEALATAAKSHEDIAETTAATSNNEDNIFPGEALSASDVSVCDSSAGAPPASDPDSYSFAWPVSAACQEVFSLVAGTPGTYFPTRDQLTCPGIVPGSEQGDPVRDTVAKYQGEAEASKRQTLTSEGVTGDTRGLQQLLSSGNYRAALSHTAALLEAHGQGKGKAGQLSKHTLTSLNIWWVRMALLVKLRQYSVAEAEAVSFGDLTNPDLYFQYYPELYPGKKGSLVPWSFRLLLAELPHYNGHQVTAMNKLFSLLKSVNKILGNIKNGLLPDGEPDLNSSLKVDQALACWKERERQVLYSLINCCILHQDYESALKCLNMLKEKELKENEAALMAAYGRLYLQLGNLVKADHYFNQASHLRPKDNVEGQVDGFVDSAFLAIGQGQFQVALERFLAAEPLASGKQAKAISNNIAVCMLYVGKLKEGLARLESSITQDQANFQANPILNLCTLYELESSYATQKKIGMLGLLSLHSPDSFQVSSLKL